MSRVALSITEAHRLVVESLVANATHPHNAGSVADALVAAEVDGQAGHGLSRVASYAAQSASGKVDGYAEPRAEQVSTAAWRIDARHGFAFPALDKAIACLAESAPETALAIATVFQSHHAGQAGYHVERLAQHGLIGLMFSNTPKAIAPWGGHHALFGTNPIAFATPRISAPPLVIDTSLSRVARGKIVLAARNGERLPEGWALDAAGKPTTDPAKALAGSLLPLGEAKGAALVLMVEILAAALTGANFAFEASSFFDGEGPPPGVGQTIIAINPGPLAGGTYADRLETLLTAVVEQAGTRLPGTDKASRRKRAAVEGIEIPTSLLAEIRALAKGNPPGSPRA